MSSYGRARRSFNRNFAAASSMRDIARFSLKYRKETFDIFIQTGEQQGASSISMFTILGQSPQYTAFASMFDQVRINGVRIRLIPKYQVSQDTNARPLLVYAWDRNGVQAPNRDTSIDFNHITTYGSAVSRTVGPSQANVITTSIYATDLAERTTYIPTAIIPQLSAFEVNTETEAIAMPFPFRPSLLVGIALPSSVSATATFAYTIEATFDLTFRGVRYSGAAE